MTYMSRDGVQNQHAIDVAAYVSNGTRYNPFMICSCGLEFNGLTWRDVGTLMDDHLGEVVRLAAVPNPSPDPGAK